MRRLAGALVAGSIIFSTQLGVTVAGTAQAATPATAPAVTSSAAPAAAPKYRFKNCTAMNKVYPHGVGRKGARDHTSGKPVTTFTVSTTLYKKVVGYRRSLDRDHDGIACERA